MEKMVKFSAGDLPRATRTLTFIQSQLAELTRNCGHVLQDGLVSCSYFMEMENKLEKILHETRAACRPPPIQPVKADFDIIKPLARGGFGTVNLVRHKETRRIFAMKQIKPRYKEQRDDILLERDILAFLDSPLVVSLFCSFETRNHMYMVMEYVGGGDFATLLDCRESLHVDVARFYIAELVLALEYIHSHGIIHRDLKPENLLITNTGHLTVADFGLSKSGSVTMASCLTKEDCRRVAREFTDGEDCGTLPYLAPEVILGTGYGKPIDWWATGIILYEFLFSFTPFAYRINDWVRDAPEVHRRVTKNKLLTPNIDHPGIQAANSLLHLLLDKNCETRLGTRGAYEVKRHPFFQTVDWSDLLNQTPPYVPTLNNEEDTHSFTGCPLLLSDTSPHGGDGSPAELTDFCYVAFRFKEEYGSPLPLSPRTLMNRDLLSEQPVHSEAVEEQEPNSTEATMDDSSVQSTKDDSSVYSTKDDSSVYSTEDDSSVYSTEDDSSVYSTKDDSSVYSTKDDSSVHDSSVQSTKDDSSVYSTKDDSSVYSTKDDSSVHDSSVHSTKDDSSVHSTKDNSSVHDSSVHGTKDDSSVHNSSVHSTKDDSSVQSTKDNSSVHSTKDDSSVHSTKDDSSVHSTKDDSSVHDSSVHSTKDNSSVHSTKDNSSVHDSSVHSTKDDSSVHDSSVHSTKDNSSVHSTKDNSSVHDSSVHSTKDDSSVHSTKDNSSVHDSSVHSTKDDSSVHSTKDNSSVHDSSVHSTKDDSSVQSTKDNSSKKIIMHRVRRKLLWFRLKIRKMMSKPCPSTTSTDLLLPLTTDSHQF